ncbi:membrane protein [Photorhabdus luminescens]|nr:membrane protein [Photorhabdus luminescens]
MVVDSKRKIIHIICAIFILSLMSFSMYIVSEYLLSLILMDEKITFSGNVMIFFFSFPFIVYFVVSAVYLSFAKRYPKHYDTCAKYLFVIAIVSVFLSFPVSFYVDYKLKSDNYLVCPRISWTSPNTYVKDMKLCD